jgi:membrane protease YdiL (CAAX protease family)
MNDRPAGFRAAAIAALIIGWAALASAGFLFAHGKGIGVGAASPVIGAFLITYPFYLAMGFREIREYLTGRALPWTLVALAALPYLACCCGALQFHWMDLVKLSALALAMALWFRVLPPQALIDLAFLAVVPAVILGRFFDSIYTPYLGQKLVTLGHVTFLPMAILPLMLERRVAETGFTFTPSLDEWRIGALHYLYFLPFGTAIGFGLQALHPHPLAPFWKIAGTFLAFLWTIALSEDFFCFGVLQQWIEEWSANRALALVLASLIFGSVHLPFPGYPFPNWRWALLAAVLGWFCGHARNQARSIGASIVTHALVVATWRAFLG